MYIEINVNAILFVCLICVHFAFSVNTKQRVRSTMNGVLTARDFLITRRRRLRRTCPACFCVCTRLLIYNFFLNTVNKVEGFENVKTVVSRPYTNAHGHPDYKKKNCFLDQEISVTVLTRALTRIIIYKYPLIVNYKNRVLHAIGNTHIKGIYVAKVFFRMHVPSNVRPRVSPRSFRPQSDNSYFKHQHVLLVNRSAAS